MNSDYETQSERSFDDGASIGASSSVSDKSRQFRLNKLLQKHDDSVIKEAGTIRDYETSSEHSIDEESIPRNARNVADTCSSISKSTRGNFFHKLLTKAENDGASTLYDGLSSIESASMFDEETTVKSSRSTQNSRRRLMQRLMEKDDQVSSIGISHLSLNN